MPKYCPSCGTEVDESDVYCPSCGESLQTDSEPKADEQKRPSDESPDSRETQPQKKKSRGRSSGPSSQKDGGEDSGIGRRKLLIVGGVGGAGILWYLLEGQEPEYTLTNGGTVQGTITVDSPRDPILDELAEPHYFRGAAGERVEISMRSQTFDTYLLLVDSLGSEVGRDDDGGTDVNSRLTTTLPRRGEYTIWAGSYSGNATGSYTLSVAFGGNQAGDSVF